MPVPFSEAGFSTELVRNLYLRFLTPFVVRDAVIVELKAVEKTSPLHEPQLLTYLKLTNQRLGLLINFNVPLLKDGIQRIVL